HDVPAAVVFSKNIVFAQLFAAADGGRGGRLGAAGLGFGDKAGIGVLDKGLQGGSVLDLVTVQLQRRDLRAAAAHGDIQTFAGDTPALEESPRSAFLGRFGFLAADLCLVILELLLERFVLVGVLDLGRLSGLVFLQGVLHLCLGVGVPGRKVFVHKGAFELFRD